MACRLGRRRRWRPSMAAGRHRRWAAWVQTTTRAAAPRAVVAVRVDEQAVTTPHDVSSCVLTETQTRARGCVGGTWARVYLQCVVEGQPALDSGVLKVEAARGVHDGGGGGAGCAAELLLLPGGCGGRCVLFGGPFRLRFTYVTSVLVKKY
jgi:hypothetical protein